MSVGLALVTVAAGGIAAVIRYLLSVALARSSNAGPYPWAVLIVNVVGSTFAGVVLGIAGSASMSTDLQLVLLTGVCGGLTTFSTLSVETIQLAQDGRWRAALGSIGANLLIGLAGCALGYALGALVS